MFNEQKYLDGDGVATLWSRIKQYFAAKSDIYPVGSIYMSVNDTDPSTLFGGTWERITGKFLLAATDEGSSGASQAAGNTGGSADAIVPSHSHTTQGSGGFTFRVTALGAREGSQSLVSAGTNTTADASGNDRYVIADNRNTAYAGLDMIDRITRANHTHEVNSTGTNAAGANMPPYLSVYIWKRTA